jgi:hypothetical protein
MTEVRRQKELELRQLIDEQGAKLARFAPSADCLHKPYSNYCSALQV